MTFISKKGQDLPNMSKYDQECGYDNDAKAGPFKAIQIRS